MSTVAAAPTPSTAVAAATQALTGQVATLHYAVTLLRAFVAESQPDEEPGRSDNMAVTELVQAADDLLDAVDAALTALTPTSRTLTSSEVVTAHRRLVEAGRVLRTDLLAVGGRFDTARRAVSPWGDQWRMWARVVRAALRDVGSAMTAADTAVADAVAAWLDSGSTRSTDTDREEAPR